MICKYLYRDIHCAPLCFYHKFTLWLCLLSKLLPFYLHKLKLASQHDCVCKDLSTCDVCLWVIHLCRAERLVFCFRDNTLFTCSRVECKLDLQRHQGPKFLLSEVLLLWGITHFISVVCNVCMKYSILL